MAGWAFATRPFDWSSLKPVALSISLPLQALPFFAGLQPEGQMRRLIAQQFQISRQNDFVLQDHIGGECAVAVAFVESGQSLPMRGADEVQWRSD